MKQAAVAIVWDAFGPNKGKTAAQNTIVMAPQDRVREHALPKPFGLPVWRVTQSVQKASRSGVCRALLGTKLSMKSGGNDLVKIGLLDGEYSVTWAFFWGYTPRLSTHRSAPLCLLAHSICLRWVLAPLAPIRWARCMRHVFLRSRSSMSSC